MNLARKLLGVVPLVLICACSGSTTSGSNGSVIVTSNSGTLNNDGSTVNITAVVKNSGGGAAAGDVTFTAPGGDLNGSGSNSVSVPLNAAGQATVSYACDFTFDVSHCGAGSVLVTAIWTSVANGTRVTLVGPSSPTTDAGTPPPPTPDAGPVVTGPAGPPAAVIKTGAAPDVLGLQGSGIQETGVMSFLVTDSAGRPVPTVAVSFSQRQPALVTLGRTVGVTDANGIALVDYAAGTEVGVSAIVATVPSTGVSGSGAIAVRGAPASASGFYFRCEKGNLPAYETTPALETMTCQVRLSDRFGNRVGVPTPVRFATEAGAIDSFAMTKAFDFANPNDPDEGSATVTFSTDMGNGFRPADVVPLAADPAQYPWPRLAEPQVAAGSLTRNPRDQFVTVIAMTDGEEAFVDANHNGVLDNNEVFYDLGDPFIDANDDGVYDQVYAGGPWEVRFCSDTSGTNCSAYAGPNGRWDPATIIWVPTWVVLSDNAAPHTAPAGTPEPAIAYVPTCVASGASSFADIFVFDEFLNSPAMDTDYTEVSLDQGTGVTPAKIGFFKEPDNWGAMGKFGLDFDYWPVLPGGGACVAPASPTAPTACVLKLFFRDFDPGFRGSIKATNGTTTGSCAAPAIFKTSIGVVNVKGPTLYRSQSGQYAP